MRALFRHYNRIMNEYQTSFSGFLHSLWVLRTFESNQTTFQRSQEVPDSFKRFIRYYWKFAHVAFGKFRILERWYQYWQHNDDILLDHCHLQKEDLIFSFWGSRDFYPGNFVALDHATEKVIWSIRATLCPEDVIMDLMADPMPFLGGYAHQGMISAVGRLMQNTWKVVEEALRRHENYELLIVGHSLGASLATMLVLYIRHHIPEVAAYGIAYACPPCLCRKLTNLSRHYVLGVTCKDDIIVRLSFSTFSALKRKLYLIHHIGNEKELEKHGYMVQKQWLFTTPDDLWPPVQQVYFSHDNEIRLVSSFDFDKIIINFHCIIDHAPPTYDSCINNISITQ